MRPLLPALLCVALAAAQEEDDPIDLALPGVVVTPVGEAVAGVRIEAWDGLEPARFLCEGASGADGRFLVAFRRSDLARRDHPFGPVRLLAVGDGLATAVADVPAGAREARLVVRPTVLIRGSVVDADGAPVPGAIVRGSAGGVVEETTAVEDGTFVLRRFAEGAALEAYRDHVGLAARLGAGAEPKLVLPRATFVRGRVVALGSAEAVAGARVFWRDRVVGETDASGAFAVAVDGSAPLFVAAPGYAVARAEGEVVALPKAQALRGRVADPAGRGVKGAVVALAGDVTFVAVADEDGLFAFDAVPKGLVRLVARAPRFLDASVLLDAGSLGDEVTVALARGVGVAGRTVREGAAAVGARVSVLDADGAEVAFGYSDAQGRFLFGGVPSSAAHLVAADANGASLSVAAGEIEEGGRGGPYLLEVKDHLPLAGRLRSDAGAPLAGAKVRCAGREAVTDREGRFAFDVLPAKPQRVEATADRHFPRAVEARPGSPLDLVLTSHFGDARLEVGVTGAALFTVEIAARFAPPVLRRASATPAVFEGLAPGSYDVRVRAPGTLEFAQVVDLPAAGLRVEAALVRGGTLRLVSSPGASVAIFAVRGKAPPVVALKLADGTQTLSDFGPGLYRFVARAPGELVVVKEIELDPTTPPKELDLRGGKESTLVVSVKDATGAPVQGAEITVATEGGFSRPVGKTDAKGELKIERLFDGRMYVRAALDSRLGESALDTTPGTALTVTVTLR
ncbi:MAG TPA: carboxypeptidase-like regulatory domain-containing protein [Planctomycetota bacterium]|nr:carboxypeptidase-like regulatory domain-containing protein [Planctomycetota bacterium]